MSLLCSTDTLREEADCIACDGYVTTSRRLEDAADEIDQLRAKNSKLRELVRRLYNMANFCSNCPDTERCDVDVEWFGCTVADPIDKLMDELGVEI